MMRLEKKEWCDKKMVRLVKKIGKKEMVQWENGAISKERMVWWENGATSQ